MDPIIISGYVDLALKLEGVIAGVWKTLKDAGVTDEQIAAIRQDYEDRIARRTDVSGNVIQGSD
jgi:hypothetical protein